MRSRLRMLSVAAGSASLLAFGLGRNVVAHADQPIAPKIEVPDDARPVDRMLVDNARVPTSRQVGVPAFPGSRVARTTLPARDGGDGEPEVAILATVTLLSDQPPAKVAEWYAGRLDGWTRHDEMGTIFLHPEDVELDMVHIGSHRLVTIGPVVPNMAFARLWPAAKTEINIAYE